MIYFYFVMSVNKNLYTIIFITTYGNPRVVTTDKYAVTIITINNEMMRGRLHPYTKPCGPNI